MFDMYNVLQMEKKCVWYNSFYDFYQSQQLQLLLHQYGRQ